MGGQRKVWGQRRVFTQLYTMAILLLFVVPRGLISLSRQPNGSVYEL